MRPSRLLALWDRLRSTYWFVPSMITAVALGMAWAAVELDRRYPDVGTGIGWLYTGGADGARALLSAVAGSMITVVSVTFSVTIVALTVSAQHFGPRLLKNFMRDTAAQSVLGVFIGTFAYCLIVLRTVQGDGDGYDSFVPHMAVTIGVGLTLVSVGALLYYVHHVSASLHVSRIAHAVADDLGAALRRLYPEPLGDPAPAPAPLIAVPADAMPVRAPRGGYIQQVDGDALLAAACEADVVVWLTIRPGDFVVEGTTIAHLRPAPADAKRMVKRITGSLVIGEDRNWLQDAGFAVQQLVEIALHALSPGMNEPFTAITCIDRLTEALATLATRDLPPPQRNDDNGRLRVVTQPETFARLLDEAFGPLRRAADDQVAVLERLVQALTTLASLARRAEDVDALRLQAAQVGDTIARTVRDGRDRTQLERRLAILHAALPR